MRGAAIASGLFLLAGCNSPDRESSAETEAPAKLTAILTCKSSGQRVPVGLCFAGGSIEGSGGSLKIESGGNVKQFTPAELYHGSDPSDLSSLRINEIGQSDGPSWQILLTAPFSIEAQANSQSGFVLRVVVQEGDKAVFKDEATEFATIDVSSASLGL